MEQSNNSVASEYKIEIETSAIEKKKDTIETSNEKPDLTSVSDNKDVKINIADIELNDDQKEVHQDFINGSVKCAVEEGEDESVIRHQEAKSGGIEANTVAHTVVDVTEPSSASSTPPTNESTTTPIDSDIKPTAAQPSKFSDSIRHKKVPALFAMLLISSGLVLFAALLWIYLGPIVAVLFVFISIGIVVFTSGLSHWLYVAIRTAPRDIRALSRFIRLLIKIHQYERKDISLADIFRQNVAKHPNKVCFIFEDTEWTFAQVEEYSNKIGNVFKSHGYRKGDTVALLMENRIEYVCTWLGLTKIGIIVPLINTNLRQNSLLHSFNVAKCQAIIFSAEHLNAMKDISANLDPKIALYQLHDKLVPVENIGDLKEHNLNLLLEEAPSSMPAPSDKLQYNDKLVYIYTSGTTGLPKAAIISTSKFIFMAAGIHYTGNFRDDDRFYTPLPLYHTAGGCMSIGQALIFGSTIVIRRKFSASQYFPDCKKYNCTVAQYIGEMCRYILAVPPKSNDNEHNLRLIFGNGLRPQIWVEFCERFNIRNVAEFYGATEGNANIVNMDNTVGSIGFVSRIIPVVYPISIIRVDEEGEPIRDKNGLCIVCKPNEPGVFIGKIIPNNSTRAFLGYVDGKASEKKIVRDVFKKGDQAFISGDILIADEFGYLFFKDRTGDTFRWKGENVSTTEIEGVVSNLINYKDAVVYGVEIHGQEGRAGMVSILDENDTINLENLATGIRKELPSYARPLFIRILTKLDLTGTYKLRKVDLQKDGYDPNKIKDKLYYLSSDGTYLPLTAEVFDKINSGKIRF